MKLVTASNDLPECNVRYLLLHTGTCALGTGAFAMGDASEHWLRAGSACYRGCLIIHDNDHTAHILHVQNHGIHTA